MQRHPARDIPTEGGLVPPSVGMLSVTGPEIGLRAGRRACHGEIKNRPPRAETVLRRGWLVFCVEGVEKSLFETIRFQNI